MNDEDLEYAYQIQDSRYGGYRSVLEESLELLRPPAVTVDVVSPSGGELRIIDRLADWAVAVMVITVLLSVGLFRWAGDGAWTVLGPLATLVLACGWWVWATKESP